jgi:hypothetical protein
VRKAFMSEAITFLLFWLFARKYYLLRPFPVEVNLKRRKSGCQQIWQIAEDNLKIKNIMSFALSGLQELKIIYNKTKFSCEIIFVGTEILNIT